jgi:hypothetical protein
MENDSKCLMMAAHNKDESRLVDFELNAGLCSKTKYHSAESSVKI